MRHASLSPAEEKRSNRRLRRRGLSLAFRGARTQVLIAIALVAFIPLLSFAFIVLTVMWPDGAYSNASRALIAVLALLLAICGYILLLKYPRNLEKLRGYLTDIAAGKIPETITFPDIEDDFRAIQEALNRMVSDLRTQVKQLQTQLALATKLRMTIEEQARDLVAAERQRVMIESLATACHHIGQPATVLRMQLESLLRSDLPPTVRQSVQSCVDAMKAVVDVMDRLRHVSAYRTVPYLTHHPGLSKDIAHQQILDIGAASTSDNRRERRASSAGAQSPRVQVESQERQDS